jgi:ABC-type uncharacterized transport system involved in gliding motility auxiliary subunit
MRMLGQSLGWLGLILFLVGVAGYMLYPMLPAAYLLPWLAALIAGGAWAWINRRRLARLTTSRTARYGAGSAASVILVLGILSLVSAFAAKNAPQWDLTADRIYSLAPQTIQILEKLNHKIKVAAYFRPGTQGAAEARILLEQYGQYSPYFDFELVDPDRHPGRAQAAGVTRDGTVVVSGGGQRDKITRLDEQTLTNALIRVTRPERKTIYFLTGHGEKDLDRIEENGYSTVKSALEDQNYRVQPLVLLQAGGVPEDAAVVVSAGPQTDPLAEEAAALEKYLRGGGRLMIMIDPESAPKLVAWLRSLGVEVGRDVVVDKMSRAVGADYLMPLVVQYSQHPIADDFTLASFFPVARSVSPVEEPSGGQAKVIPLALTGESAWAESDLAAVSRGTAEFDEAVDRRGPISMAVVGTIGPRSDEESPEKESDPPADPRSRLEDDRGRILVFGDSDFAANSYFDLQGNGDLFLNSVAYLAEEGDKIAIRPKKRETQPLYLTAFQSRLIQLLALFVVPFLVAAVGVAVGMKRRKNL